MPFFHLVAGLGGACCWLLGLLGLLGCQSGKSDAGGQSRAQADAGGQSRAPADAASAKEGSALCREDAPAAPGCSESAAAGPRLAPVKKAAVADKAALRGPGQALLDPALLAPLSKIQPKPALVHSVAAMVKLPGGSFDMGGDRPPGFEKMTKMGLPQPDEFPKHRVRVDAFYMDIHEVTVAQFEAFVKETGYLTVAERPIDWQALKEQLPPNTPKPPAERLQPGSLVFHYASKSASKKNMGNWWVFTPGVDWRNPDGKKRPLKEMAQWPVTQISYYDALAYAQWHGGRLPTEAEFEFAMRSGQGDTMYPWGNEQVSVNHQRGNFLQGEFPFENTKKDGFEMVAPVQQFPPNAYGLYDLAGNVWEWTNDWYSPLYYSKLDAAQQVAVNPQGPPRSQNARGQAAFNKSVRGGSFLCHDDWCSGFRNARRMRLSPDTGMQHLGFRIVKDVPQP